ncbi:MAG: cold shock domain-containing protein [Thermoflexus sp.]|nr:cold shock domain-containing protein [Thermoflexus sp.]
MSFGFVLTYTQGVHQRSEARTKGTFCEFNRTAGYGFSCLNRGEKDIFVHDSRIARDVFRNLKERDRVELSVRQTARGPQAYDVTRLLAGSPDPAIRLRRPCRRVGPLFFRTNGVRRDPSSPGEGDLLEYVRNGLGQKTRRKQGLWIRSAGGFADGTPDLSGRCALGGSVGSFHAGPRRSRP